jgi:hypothetical protein
MQELAVEWTRDIEEAEKNVQEAKQNVEQVEELCAKIAGGTVTPDDMVEAADLLRRGVSPDDDNIPDALCDSEDESSEEEGKTKVGMKRKRAAKKMERKRAERKRAGKGRSGKGRSGRRRRVRRKDGGDEKRRWWKLLHQSGRLLRANVSDFRSPFPKMTLCRLR